MIARPTVVPYVAHWTGEVAGPVSELTVERFPRLRLAYKDTGSEDRDAHGVLWVRLSGSPGDGRPRYECMHPRRQRECMTELKCQVCGGAPSVTEDGYLFIDWHEPYQPRSWPERAVTTLPPLCGPCALISVRQCPHIGRSSFTVLRARRPVPWGLGGAVYQPIGQGSLGGPPPRGRLPYGHPALRWIVASQLVMELREVTVLNPEALGVS